MKPDDLPRTPNPNCHSEMSPSRLMNASDERDPEECERETPTPRRRHKNIHNANIYNRRSRSRISARNSHNAISHLFLLCLFYFLHLPHSTTANKPPQFVLSEGQSEIVLRLKEGKETPVGSLIYTLRAHDPEDDRLTFGLRGQIANEIFQIENLGTNEANLYLKKELDREVEDEYMFIVTLTDGNLPEGNFVTQSLLLLVDDINDSVPAFLEYNTTLKVPENSNVPMVLTRLEAVDRDEGPYGQVVYKLHTEPGDEDLFSISTQNGQGVVRLLKPLDYEKKFLHQIKVLAVDRAISGQINTATAALVVNVLDEEDTPPYFLNVQPVSRIREDVPVGSYLLQAVAVDGDRGVNNEIKYSLLNENELFGIDSQSGIIYTKAALDRDHVLGGSYILQVVATEQSKGTPKPSVSTEITVIVTDVNDEQPTFKSSHYQAEVVENSPVDVPLTFLGDSIPECYDYDLGPNGTFRLYTHGDGNIFDITPSEGINHVSFLIRVKNPARLDYEKLKGVNFTLICEEISGEKGSSAGIQVFIRDANDNHPEFTKSVYMASVFENSLPGTSIIQVQAHDVDSGDFGTEGIRYTSLSGPIANMLHLDSYSGVITVVNNSLLDREMNSLFHLTVEARDLNGQGNRNTAVVQISLLDMNDQSPIFLSSRYEGRVFENEVEFVTPLQVQAVDGDMQNTPNSQVRYSIVAGNENKHFEIDKESGVISIIKPLDFEKLPVVKPNSNVKQLNFTVRANDLGKPPRFSLAQVKVFVSDMNDYNPSWKESVYNKIIREDVAAGTEILQVVGFDKDGSPPFNRVLYRIEKGDQDKFIIDADTGIIRLAYGAKLDYNAKTNHLLDVYMLDGGGLKSLPALVNISLIDVNNKSPKFILNNGGVYHAKVMEGVPVGTYITQVRANDPDLKPLLRYEIDFNQSEARNDDGLVVNGVPLSSMFELQAADGVLKVGGNIDREKISSVKLRLVVEDVAAANGVKQFDTADMILTILDDNDNAPVFSKNPYIASVPENSANGTTVVKVSATDIDTSPGNIIAYSLRPQKGDADRLNFPLKIDSQTGVITVVSKIDREARHWLNFTVVASDSGPSYKNSATAEVLLKILDENDSSPKFVDTITNITVPEDISVGYVVGQVKAVDSDEGEFGKVFYILDRQTSLGKFAIDSLTGVITVAEPLDREETSSLFLNVQAYDNYRYGYSVGESRSDFKQIAVNVLDSNDEVPEFDAEQLKTKVSVSEFHEGVITTVRAYDRDDPDTPNSWVSFKIKGGNDLNLFKLEQGKNIAKILPARALKGFFGNYTLVIEARDSGRPSNAVEAEQHIEITDTNDSPPRFLFPRQNTTLKIAENTSVGSTLLIVRGVDDDIGLNGLVRYRLRKDLAGHFRTFDIHEINGVLTLKEPLDRERQKLYQIRVEAFDLGLPIPLSSDLDLTLIVTNVDDHKPQFGESYFMVNFTENANPLSERFQLPETVDLDDIDDEEAKAAQVCYFIIPDARNSSKIFAVDPLQHFITTKVRLDREKVSNYTLRVAATDDCTMSGDPTKAGVSILTVHIFVTDENDSAPRFSQRVFSGGVSTSTDFGNEFMNVVAVDDDFDDEISYSIVHPIMILLSDGLNHLNNNEALFQLNNETGTISLGFDPQPNMKGHFLITVQATDQAGHYDRAKALVYLLRDDQKVRVVVRQNPADIRKRVNEFVNTLSNVTGVIVNVDLSFKFHQHKDGSVDKTKTCFLIHFVHPEKNLVLDVQEALRLIDLNIEELDDLFKEFNVVDTEAATLPLLPAKEHTESRNIVIVYATGSAIFLTVLLFVVISLCFAQRTKFQRQLKAATANSYGSNSCSTNPPRIATGTIPNTNVHSTEGSNPIWMQAYHNNWYKEDSVSENSETRDSLDENAVSSSSPSSHLRSFVGSDNEKRKNDLNRTFHKNLLYNNRIDSNTCLILKKHLETTEL